MFKCPFCGAIIVPLNPFEFPCPVCGQLVGVLSDGPRPRLVRSAPEGRKLALTSSKRFH
jgi:hypothetical protein